MMPGDCPKCGGALFLAVPDATAAGQRLYGCKLCFHTCQADGTPFVECDDLKDVFRAATEGQAVYDKMLASQHFSPAARAVFQAEIVSYGLQMWQDGFKQGLLMGALKTTTAEAKA
jgi:hypothetical protein